MPILALTAELMTQKLIITSDTKWVGEAPKRDALPVNGVIAPYVFVGDDAFALKKFMMKPSPQPNLTADMRV